MGSVRGSGGTFPGNFEILHGLKGILGAPEALFRTCTQSMQVATFDQRFQIEKYDVRGELRSS